jgi:hypothetical protein
MKHTFASAISAGWPNCEWSLYNSDDFTTLSWLSPDTPQPTLEEVEAMIVELDSIEAKRLLRVKRNAMLQETDVKSLPDYPHKNDDERAAWLAYRQQLRDLLVTAIPSLTPMHDLDEASIEWPQSPNY